MTVEKFLLRHQNPFNRTLVAQATPCRRHIASLKLMSVVMLAIQAGADSLVSFGLDVFGNYKWAGRMRAETRRAIEREKKAASQPYMELKEAIDLIILEGDKLKLKAKEYFIIYRH